MLGFQFSIHRLCSISLSVSAILTVGSTVCDADIIQWTGGGDALNWEDPLNWQDGALPGPDDFASISDSGSPVAIRLNSDQAIGNMAVLRDRLIHSGGKATVGSAGQSNSSFFAGPGPLYTMTGAAEVEFRGTGSISFDEGALAMSDSSRWTSSPDLTVVLGAGSFVGSVEDDASFTAGTITLGDIVPDAVLSFSDRSTFSFGSIFVNQIDLGGPGSMLSFIGSSVTAAGTDFALFAGATLSYVGDVDGISMLGVSGSVRLSGDPHLSIDLNSFPGSGPLTLIDGSEEATGQFFGLPEGALVAGTSGRTITYSGGDGFDIMLIPEPSLTALIGVGMLCLFARRSR